MARLRRSLVHRTGQSCSLTADPLDDETLPPWARSTLTLISGGNSSLSSSAALGWGDLFSYTFEVVSFLVENIILGFY